MSKSVSVGLAAHLQLEVTTLATCWKATLTDGAVMGFTDHVENLVVGGLTYQAATGYTASSIQTSAGTEVDNLELLGVIDPSALSQADLQGGRWDFAEIEIFQVNYNDLTQGTLPLRKGTLGEVTLGKTRFQAELRGLSQKLTQRIGRVIAPACDADLGDARCGINLATFPGGTVTGTITGVLSKRIFADTALTQPVGWFDSGKITMNTGLNAGKAREVKTYTAGQVITLQEAFPYAVAFGDAYTMTAGCLKRFLEDCDDKFSNTINFRGYPHLPGIDRMISGT